ncbi:hypothetical protein Sjap_013015 [Stephania japonica]|uniref:Uncharacterized protein n=1 Tax=Stephania japonica TaxID=461633 RepID=A0AAP0NY82_9MAGN
MVPCLRTVSETSVQQEETFEETTSDADSSCSEFVLDTLASQKRLTMKLILILTLTLIIFPPLWYIPLQAQAALKDNEDQFYTDIMLEIIDDAILQHIFA